MKTAALDTLAAGIADTITDGATEADIKAILRHDLTLDALMHAATAMTAGKDEKGSTYLAEARERTFAPSSLGGVGLQLEAAV